MFLKIFSWNWFITNLTECDVSHAVGRMHPVIETGNVSFAERKKKHSGSFINGGLRSDELRSRLGIEREIKPTKVKLK